MATLAELQARREQLATIRAKGTRELEYDGRRVVYKSDDELAAAIQDLDRQIQQLGGTRVSTIYISACKGI